MIPLTITPNIEQAPWTDAANFPFGKVIRIGRLPRGTKKGRSTVTIMIEMQDGQRFMAETTLALMSSALIAMQASAEREGEYVGMFQPKEN